MDSLVPWRVLQVPLLKDSIREISGAVAHPPSPKCPKLEEYVGQLELSGVEK